MNDDLDKRLQELLGERGRVEPDAIDRALGGIDALPERRSTRRAMPFAAAAGIALAVLGLALATLLPSPTDVATLSPTPSTPSQAPSPSTAAVTPSPTATLQPRPVWAMDLASHLDCDGPPSTIGMDVPAVPEPVDPVTTPVGALVNTLVKHPSLPMVGYTPTLEQDHWALHRYLVDGRPKVHIVTTNHFPDAPQETRWEVVGWRACDQSEFANAGFGPEASTIWSDAAGDPVRTDRIRSNVGSDCFDKFTVLLSYFDPEATQFLRDPTGDLERFTVVPFAREVRLPADAVDTGLHTDDYHLFTVPSRRAVFVRLRNGTYELWPRVKEPIPCL